MVPDVTSIGQAVGTPGGATVTIKPNGGFITNAVLMQNEGLWLVDDLVQQSADGSTFSIYSVPLGVRAC